MSEYSKDSTPTGQSDSTFSTSAPVVEKEFEAILGRMKVAVNAKSDTELGIKMGLKQSAISSAKTRGQVPAAWIVSMAQGHGISADWLLTGVGQPYVGAVQAKSAIDCQDRKVPQMEGGPKGTAQDYRDRTMPQMHAAHAGTAMASQIERGKALDNASTLTPVVDAVTPEYIECMDCRLAMVPMVEARLSAGTGSFEVEAGVERRYAFRSDWINSKGNAASMVLMRVAGDSMEPQIFNNDVVLVDQSQTTPRAGGLFAIGVEDVVYIKMVDTLPGKIVLKSYNDAYAPLEIDARGDLADGIRIIGRAVWVGRELY